MGTQSTFDRMIDALAHPYRRQLLMALTEHNPQAVDGGLDADRALAAAAGGIDAEDIPSGGFVRAHIAKLDRYGYISEVEATGEIATGPNWTEIEPLLHLLREHQDELPGDWLAVPDDELAGPEEEEEPAATPELLRALTDECNQLVLQYFDETDANHAQLTELAGYVADRHRGTFEHDRTTARIHLHHAALPQLADHDLIVYQWRSRVIRKPDHPHVPNDLRESLRTLDVEH